MQVLLLGSGGREHALAWKLRRSPRLRRLYAAPGNPGIGEEAELVPLDIADHAAVIAFCRRAEIDFVFVGPEAPLVAGIVDDLAAAGIRAFGPSREAARLEGSKGYTKDLCREAGIPTAAYRRFTDRASAGAYVRAQGAPIVVKADGLAAGKGVTVAATVAEALDALAACFAAPGAEVVVEECLAGREASFFALSDGTTAIPFGTAEDHKRVGDGDTGPNTGGMGAFSPSPLMTPAMVETAMTRIIRPTVAAMAGRGSPYRGVLYAGLMLTADGPKLIEYNARFGDPETQVLMLRYDGDLVEALLATVDGTLDRIAPVWSSDAALTVVMAAKGYPGAHSRGSPIAGIDRANALPGVKIFHAGTAMRDGRLVAGGGRVLNVTGRGGTLAEAQARAYAGVAAIDWPGGFCRHDIGAKGLGGDHLPAG
ncbi:MAG TPA: phosphoribosylamine--glycine ligase [Bauldia sp.]|nr:phosphoribosylamine--glycine ligase [Bauldia sp.]